MDLVAVPRKAELTEIEEFVLDHCLDYGIIAGGFAAYLFNPTKFASDIDMFVNDHIDGEAYDKLYHHLGSVMSFWKKLKYRMQAGYPQKSKYNEHVGLQPLTIYDYTKKNTRGHNITLQLVTHINKNDTRHATTESILESFDWNVCRAAVLDKNTLLVDRHFLEDMEANRVTFRPYSPRKSQGEDYGWRLFKYVELKGYDMPFKDMLTIFGLVENKKQFYDQLCTNGHETANKNLLRFKNYIQLMMNSDPTWQGKGDF